MEQQPKKKKIGRPTINAVKMTNVERQRRYLSNPENLAKHKLRVKEYNKRKNSLK